MEAEPKEPLFQDIDGGDEQNITSIDSLCMSCHENGITRMLLTRIPFFKDIVVMSFECPHCGFTNNEVQSAGKIQDKGCTITLSISSTKATVKEICLTLSLPESAIETLKDLNRQVVKSDAASFTIPELEFESPAFSQKGELNTIEGLLERAITGLEEGQPVRKIVDPATATKIDHIISQLTKCREGEMKFTLILDDTSGNSFIENPIAPDKDPLMTVVHYTRQPEQDARLGIRPSSEGTVEEGANEEEEEDQVKNIKDEVLNFPTNCSSCNAPTETRMKVVAIPHFKEVIIMATTCDACGHKTNEVKSGSGIEPKGTRITLRITDPMDLNRDVLKSETCEVRIPSLDFGSNATTLGGRFTTLEGLLTNMREQLQTLNPFGFGDSPAIFNEKLTKLLSGFDKLKNGEMLGAKITLDDPAGNSYIQNLYAPDPDPELEVVHYERTKEQDDELGILDMKTEGYEQDS